MRVVPFVLIALALTASDRAAAQSFTRITTGPAVNDGGASRSVNWLDVDGNGTLDLYVTNGPAAGEKAFLYLNSGAPSYSFTKVTGDPSVNDAGKSDGASAGDLDNDGDLDICVVTWYGDVDMLYTGNGDGSFTKVLSGPVVESGGHSETCSFGDYDNDGLLDLYVSNSGDGVANAEANFLYHNEGGGIFTAVTSGPEVTDIALSRGATWIDYDDDGDQDLFVVNEENQNENLYRNQLIETGTASFVAITSGDIVTGSSQSFSGAWADYDNDRDMDVLVINSGSQHEQLYRNDGGGAFTRIAGDPLVTSGGWSVSGDWADVDNDGDLDVFVSNAFGGGTKRNFLFMNQKVETGTASFVKVTTGAIVTDLGWTYGATFGDYDQDGDLDLFCARTVSNTENNSLYRNDNANGNHWLVVRCRGVDSNRSAIGAKVRVKATIAGQPTWLTRVVQGQTAYCGQNLELHFGLGGDAVADSVVVEWPAGGRDVLSNFAADRAVTITEGTGVTSSDSQPLADELRLLCFAEPNPFAESTTLRYRLTEAADVSLSLHDASGRLLQRITRGVEPAGWRSLSLAPEQSGVIFYRLRAGDSSVSGRLIRRP